jgi:hypothetical protein
MDLAIASPERGAAGTTTVHCAAFGLLPQPRGRLECFSDVQALDPDDAGRRAMLRVGDILGRRSVSNIMIVDVDQLPAIAPDGSPRAVGKEIQQTQWMRVGNPSNSGRPRVKRAGPFKAEADANPAANLSAKPVDDGPAVFLISAAGIKPEAVHWLWENYLAKASSISMARRRQGVQSDIIGQAEFSRRSIVYVYMAGAPSPESRCSSR